METPVGPTYEFGPFVLNAASGELLKYGRRVKIQEQPLRLLLILLENAGQLVTREQIQKHIWQGNTHVDFDSGLRVAVRKLREAVGDDAENPRYVETIPKRGYRFIAPAPPSAPRVMPPSETSAELPPPAASPPPSTRTWPKALILFLLLAAGAGTGLYLARGKKTLTTTDTVLLADFSNGTGDPVFDDSLRQAMAIELEQSPFLKLVAEERIHDTLSLMGQPTGARLTPAIARELCQRAASAAVLQGSIAEVGTRYLLTFSASNCVTGESLASTQAQASDKTHVLEALSTLASAMRYKLGESLKQVRKFHTPLEEATTPSLDALKALSSGRKVWLTEGESGAIPFYKRAVELDPHFALAYAWLGVALTTLGESDAAAAYTRKAYELRSQTSEPEKYFIATVFYKEVTGNLKEAEQTCKFWKEDYPRADMPHTYLAGAIYPETGEYEKAAQEAAEAVALKPDSPISYAFLMLWDTALLRLDAAKAAFAQARRNRLSSFIYPIPLYQIGFLQDDRAAMARQAMASAGQAEVENELLSLQADTAAYSGRLREARELSRQAVTSAQSAKQEESAATHLAVSALREALLGNAKEARALARMAARLSSARDPQYGAALALLYAGDVPAVQPIVGHLAERFPEDTIVQSNYLPTLRAKLALARNNFAQAIELLRAASPYELGQTSASSYGWNALYPVYVRGEAYLAARRGGEAAAEFQKILDHRGIVVNQPIGALAHVAIARAYAMQGETARAKAAYQDFLVQWKDADPDLRVLNQAKSEYAKLK